MVLTSKGRAVLKLRTLNAITSLHPARRVRWGRESSSGTNDRLDLFDTDKDARQNVVVIGVGGDAPSYLRTAFSQALPDG
jgi:hypothetical protein